MMMTWCTSQAARSARRVAILAALGVMCVSSQASALSSWDFRVNLKDNVKISDYTADDGAILTAYGFRSDPGTTGSTIARKLKRDKSGLGVKGAAGGIDNRKDGKFEFIILALNSDDWQPVSMTIRKLAKNDDFQIFGFTGDEDALNDDLTNPALLPNAWSPTPSDWDLLVSGNRNYSEDGSSRNKKTLTLNFADDIGTFQYLAFSGNASQSNDDFRLGSLVGSLQNVPEPGSLALFGLGLFGLGAMGRRRAAG